MKVKIYQPVKTAMQSGVANTKRWLLEVEKENARFIEPLMGWTGSTDTKQQLKMYFDSKDAAIAYAEKRGLEYTVILPKKRSVKPKSYAENFK
ncbi:MAG: hypothetical protein EB060_05540 [Proteobacteria bacterium]|nr:hypothetical protein [Pseudomonadota bacterium]